MEQVEKMDRIYRYQRHFYDLTRKYFLFGRDTVLQRMELQPGDRVLEVGCGTARNLIRLQRLRPDVRLFGLDASQEMLATAERKLARRKLDGKIVLKHCLAEELDYRSTFGLNEPFDAMLFSYSLSMIPTWPLALDAALKNLKPGRTIYIVDFWDQRDYPRWFAALLKRWLALFSVHYRPELLTHLESLSAGGRGQFAIESVMRRYAFIGRFHSRQGASA